MRIYIKQEGKEELTPVEVSFGSIAKAYIYCSVLEFIAWAILGVIIGFFTVV